MDFDNKLKPKKTQVIIPDPIDENPAYKQEDFSYVGGFGDHTAPYPNQEEGIGLGLKLSFPLHEAKFNENIINYQNYDYNTDKYIDNQLALDVIKAAKNNPDYELTVYRVMPKTASKINTGDWVTINSDHAKSLFTMLSKDKPVKDGYHIVKKKVKAKDLYGRSEEMDDINSYGYYGK
jgi:hypothetical protein